jgi:hypothetical protein
MYASVLYVMFMTQQQHLQKQPQPPAAVSPYKIRRHKRTVPRLPEHLIEKQKRDTGQLIVRQTFFDGKPTEILVEKQKFKRPKQAPGRPSERISEDELKKAIRIIQWDMQKQGTIMRWKCPQHGKLERTFDVDVDGVRVWCEICGLTTHFMTYNYNPTDLIHDTGRTNQEDP